MLIDDVQVRLEGGKGGGGAVAFNKTKKNLGPTGSNGGPGGDLILEGVSDISTLQQFRFKKMVKADDGESGNARLRDGMRGVDLILKVPVGTVVTNEDTGVVHEITYVGEQLMVAKGGYRGRGNYHFRASTNTTPMESEAGEAGESFMFHLQLKLIADVGLVGLPNAGKSSLLNSLTGAHSKIGNYAFTTLEPSLGAYYDLILADIPGLIEGASSGKGLGTKFLKHVERTRSIFHLISSESDDVVRDYKVIRKELELYNPVLLEKNEYIFLSKTDLVDSKEVQKNLKKLGKISKQVLPLSVLDDASLASIQTVLNAIAESKKRA